MPDAERPTRRFGTGGAILSLRRSEGRVYDAPALPPLPVLAPASTTMPATDRIEPVGRTVVRWTTEEAWRTGVVVG